MPAPVRKNTKQLAIQTTPVSGFGWPVDMLTTVAIVAVIGAATAMGGPLWGVMMGAMGLLYVAHSRQQVRNAELSRQQQENLSHFLLSNASAEDMAKLRGGGDLADKGLFEFLHIMKETYGGESVRGTGRLPSDEQTEAVAPGISLTLAHDLGWWYAKLVLSGETGRQFLNGEYTQYKGRGRTPEEAIEAVIKRCGTARQQRLIQDYAAKLVSNDE